MNVTFLIGNGFDLNIGLNTTYKSFIKNYIDNKSDDNAIIHDFKKNISENEESWAAAELALGQYTKMINKANAANVFSECHEDFCLSLAEYLKKEQARVDFDRVNNASELFSNSILNLLDSFGEEENSVIKKSMSLYDNGFCYNFINFNYTDTLDRIVNMTKQTGNLGVRSRGSYKYKNRIGDLVHVHGSVNKNMALGVDNEKQVGDISIFKNVGGEYKNQIIKPDTNKANRENIEQKVYNIIKNSNMFYIYGMSIGETDARWWKRIGEAMKKDANIHLIIHCHNAPEVGVINRKRHTFESKVRKDFLTYSDFDDETKEKIEVRIHIQSYNIFDGLEGVALNDGI